MVEYPGQVITIPLEKLKIIDTGHALDYDGIHVHIDAGVTSKALSKNRRFKIVQWVTIVAHYSMRFVSIISIVSLLVIMLFREKIVTCRKERTALLLIAALALSIVLPRLGLLAAVDSFMYPGDEPRYLSAAAFTVWFFSTFTLAFCIRNVLRWLKVKCLPNY